MKKPETTGAMVAALAGRIMQSLAELQPDDRVTASKSKVRVSRGKASDNTVEICTVAELYSVVASALTQAKDKKQK